MPDKGGRRPVVERTDMLAHRSWWAWIAVAGLVVVAAVVLVARSESNVSSGYVCTEQGGQIFDVATPDAAFEAWWQSVGPTEAAQMTQAYPAISADAPVLEDFARSAGAGAGETVVWRWTIAEGELVAVSVSRVATAEGWMVAANRCSSD